MPRFRLPNFRRRPATLSAPPPPCCSIYELPLLSPRLPPPLRPFYSAMSGDFGISVTERISGIQISCR